MDTGTLVIAALAAVSIILIALGISMAGSSGVTLERLERYAASAKPEPGTPGSGGVAELIAKSAALAQLNKAVEKRDFGANLLRDLGAADLKLKPSEYIAIWGGLTVGVPVVMFLVGFVVKSLQNPLVLLIGALIGPPQGVQQAAARYGHPDRQCAARGFVVPPGDRAGRA